MNEKILDTLEKITKKAIENRKSKEKTPLTPKEQKTLDYLRSPVYYVQSDIETKYF